MKNRIIASIVILTALFLIGCQAATTNVPAKNPTVVFKLSRQFTFGNTTTGYSAPLTVWLAGTFNNWVPNDADYVMKTDANGDFEYTLPTSTGTVIKFKYIVKTALSPTTPVNGVVGSWWTSMQSAYSAVPVLCVSPALADVTIESDGYGGYNAVYIVK